MNTRLLFGLLWLMPTLCFGALSTDTSYFLNVEALTNVTARSAVRGLTGVFTNGIASGASTFTGEITSTLGTITADASALDATATWNAAGVTFSGGKLNITDTASAAGSLLWEWQVGGNPAVTLPKRGAIAFPLSSTTAMTQPGVGNWSGSLGIFGTSGTLVATVGTTSMNLSSTVRLLWNNDTELNRDGAANTLQIGADSATAAAQTFKGPDGSGTDKVGGALQLGGGKSTGTAAGGSVILYRANSAGASGSTLNTYSELFHAPAKWVTLTESTATTIYTLPVPATNYVGFTATVTIYATDGTDHQSKTSVVTVDAIAKTTVITPTVSQVDNTTAASAGTLTCTYTVTDNGSNVLALKADAASSLSQTVLRAKLVLTAINSNGTAAGTEQ